jgi:hypothetical protein
LNVGGNVGSNLELNSSYAISNHFSAFANGMITLDSRKKYEEDTLFGYKSPSFEFKNYQIEAALGYYYNNKNKSFHDFYLGYGLGNSGKKYFDLWSTYGNFKGGIESKFDVFFLQTSHSINMSENFQALFSFRLNRIFNHSYNYQIDVNRYPEYRNIQKEFIVPQAGLGLQYHFDVASISIKGQISGVENSEYYSVRPVSFFLGLQINVNKIIEMIKEADSL